MRVAATLAASVIAVVATASVVQGWVTSVQSPSWSHSSSHFRAASTPSSSSSSSSSSTTTSLYSTTTPITTTTSTTPTTMTELSPEYAAALDMIVQTVSANLPESMQKSSSSSNSGSGSNMVSLLLHFAKEYIMASQNANRAVLAGTTIPALHAPTDPISSAKRFIAGVQYGFKYGLPSSPDLYTFDVSHVALDGTQDDYDGIDYYSFGCNFFRSVMDLTSVEVNVMNSISNLEQIQTQLQNGENVIMFANHQSEADPQVVSACLELAGYGEIAKQMIYVAGHKVTTDPLAIPFSMGRNLLCIHSKKHIDADPDTKPIKQKQNLKAMNALLTSLKDDTRGSIIWVAPSGGRDRRNVETNTVPIAPFDSKTIDMFRLMGNKSKRTTHYYTMAMVSYDLCPPPDFVEAGVGESRNVRFSPVGIVVGKELESVGGLESRQVFCTQAQQQCEEDYTLLQQALLQ